MTVITILTIIAIVSVIVIVIHDDDDDDDEKRYQCGWILTNRIQFKTEIGRNNKSTEREGQR